jgi:hypothetical protein
MQKISYLLSISFVLFFTSSNIAQTDNLSIIELSFQVKEFQKYIAKDEMNKLIPLIVVSNDHFSEYLEVDFEGKKVAIFPNKTEADLEEGQIFIDIKKFKIRDEAAILKFKYNGYTIRIKHKKKDGAWIFNTFSLKGNKKRYLYSEPVN